MVRAFGCFINYVFVHTRWLNKCGAILRMYNGWLFGEVFSTDDNITNPPDEMDRERELHLVTTSSQKDSKELNRNAIIHHTETRASKKRNDSKIILHDAEMNMKVGLFCIVLRYFDVINRVKNEKKLSLHETVMSSKKHIIKERPERTRMKEEEENTLRRKLLASFYYEKAKRGETRKLLRRKDDRTKIVRMKYCNL